MANSVFGADSGKPVIIRSGKAVVTVGGQTLLALNVTVTFERRVDVVPALGKKRIISVGEPQGTFEAQTVLAKSVDAFSAFKLSDEGCNPFDISLTFTDGGCDMNGKTVTCKNCISSRVTVNAQGGQGYIAEGVQAAFTALEMK